MISHLCLSVLVVSELCKAPCRVATLSKEKMKLTSRTCICTHQLIKYKGIRITIVPSCRLSTHGSPCQAISKHGSLLRVMDLRKDDITGYAFRFAPPNDACSVGAAGKQPAPVSKNRRIGDEPADAVHDLQESGQLPSSSVAYQSRSHNAPIEMLA